MTEELPKITAVMLKEAGLNCWFNDFVGPIGAQFTRRGYTFREFRQAVIDFCYVIDDSRGTRIRLNPKFDPQAKPCPVCADPEIVMQPIRDNIWCCPKCKLSTDFDVSE